MTVSYNRLWKLLIDRNMSKTQLIKKAGISTNAMAHMGKLERKNFMVRWIFCSVNRSVL